MIDKALETIKRYNMIKKGDTIAVCLSGGADSMALFHLLCCLKDRLSIEILAVHINHGLRKESEEEEKFVIEYCKKKRVKTFVFKGDMGKKEKPQGLSTESWAREVRYSFFAQVAKENTATLATAHTLSDKSETILLNISRGSGIKGAVGIPAKRDNIIRPLIDCTRSEIEEYCKENSVPYVTDKTNFEDIYSRNKIRLKVLPILKEINSQVENALGEFSKETEDIYTFLTQLSDSLYKNSLSKKGFDISVIKRADAVIIKNFLRNILEQYGCLSRDNVVSIFQGLSKCNFKKQLSAEIVSEIHDGYLTFGSIKEVKKHSDIEKKVVEIDKITSFLSKNYKISRISYKEFENIKKNDKNCLTYCIDCDRIDGKLFFRTRKTGDAISITERNVTKTVKKLLIEDRVPQEQRDRVAVLSDDTDRLIWLEGYGISKPFSVTEKTKTILIIEEK